MAARTAQPLRDEVVRLYRDGTTAPVAARRVGVSTSAAYRALYDAGIRPTDLERCGERGEANRRFRDDEEASIAARYGAGESLSQLAAAYGVVLQTIRNALRRRGVERRRRGGVVREFSTEQVQDIYRRWQAGESQSAISAGYHSSQTTISRVLQLHGLPIARQHPAGNHHGKWKGGRAKHRNGYVFVRVDADDPLAVMRNTGGYVLEHRLVMARSLGRPLEHHETVHHINGNPADNHIDNLQLRQGRHGRGVVHVCFDCGSTNITSKPIHDTRHEEMSGARV